MSVEEIISRGRRPIEPWPRQPVPAGPVSRIVAGGGTVGPGVGPRARREPDRDDGPIITPPTGAFVPPPVPPQLIPEVITRGTATRPPFGFGTVPRVGLGAFFAVVGGVFIAEVLRERSQAKLEKEFAELMRERKKKPDTPVIVTQTEIIPEIVVTPSDTDLQRALRRIPQPPPLITPDFDPFVLVPIMPRIQPQPVAVPDVAIPAPVVPEIAPAIPATFPLPVPTVSPTTAPRVAPFVAPMIRPGVAPEIRPGIAPFVQPQIGVSPLVGPRVSTTPLTGLRTGTVASTRRQVAPRASLQPQAQGMTANCPPCPKTKKEQEKPRDRCYKKLVREGLLPSMDTSYEWEEIDCITGRSL